MKISDQLDRLAHEPLSKCVEGYSMTTITVEPDDIIYGLSDGFSSTGMYCAACPRCGGRMRDWGTVGDFSGFFAEVWKCLGDCGCFNEPCFQTVTIERGRLQALAVAERVRRDPSSKIDPLADLRDALSRVASGITPHVGGDDQHVNVTARPARRVFRFRFPKKPRPAGQLAGARRSDHCAAPSMPVTP